MTFYIEEGQKGEICCIGAPLLYGMFVLHILERGVVPSFAFCLSRFYVWVVEWVRVRHKSFGFYKIQNDLQSQVFHTNQGTRA